MAFTAAQQWSNYASSTPVTDVLGVLDGMVMIDEKSAVAKTTVILADSTIYGLTLEDGIGICTLMFLLLQIGMLLPRYIEAIIRGYRRVRLCWAKRRRR